MRIEVTPDSIKLVCESDDEFSLVNEWFRVEPNDNTIELPLESDSPDFALLEELIDCRLCSVEMDGKFITSSKQLRGMISRYV